MGKRHKRREGGGIKREVKRTAKRGWGRGGEPEGLSRGRGARRAGSVKVKGEESLLTLWTGCAKAGLYEYALPYPSFFMSLVGAFRICSGTPGSGGVFANASA